MKNTGFKLLPIQPNNGLLFAVGLLLNIIIVGLVSAQGNNHDPSNPGRGIVGGSSYSISEVENINLTNGNVMFHFPLASLPPGRTGLSGSIGLMYNSKLYDTSIEQIPDHNQEIKDQNMVVTSQDGGWRLVNSLNFQYRVISRFAFSPMVDCSSGAYDYGKNASIWKVQVVFPDGNAKEFRPVGHSDYYEDGYFRISPNGWESWANYQSIPDPPSHSCNLGETQFTTDSMVYYSTDGSFLRLVVDHDPNPNNKSGASNSWTLYFPDGSFYQSSTGRLTDRYGEYLQNVSFTHNQKQANGIEDSMGRRIFYTPGDYSTETDVFLSGFSGQELKWTIRWKDIHVKKEYETTGAEGLQNRGGTSYQTLWAGFQVVHELQLPAQLGNQKYVFGYNGSDTPLGSSEESEGWGEISSLQLPSGAVFEYEYKWDGPPELWTPRTHEVLGNFVKKKIRTHESQYDGSSPIVSDVWHYTIGKTGSTITSPDGSTMLQLHGDTSRVGQYNGLIHKIENSNGTKIEKLWGFNIPSAYVNGSGRQVNSFVTAEFTSIKDNNGNYVLTAIKEFSQDKNGNTILVKEYDHIPYANVPRNGNGEITGVPGGITPSRVSATTFHNPTPVWTDTTTNSTYAYWNFNNIKGVTASSEVRDSVGQIVSKTEITYDNPSTTANPTLTRVWDSTKGSVSDPLTTGNSISTSAEYDQYGNVTKTIDARGVETVITYGNVAGPSGNVTGLYPTKTEAAANYSTLTRTSTAVYDFYTGLVTSAKDEDNDVTVVTEYDDLGRPVKVRNAYGTALESWTTSEYDDINRRVVVRSDLETKGDGKKVAIQHFDQLGRVRLSRTLEDSSTESPYNEQHGIKVQTRYLSNGFTCPWDDAQGPDEICSGQLTSNPYRANYSHEATGEETMGWTLGLAQNTGRHSTVTTFSGASLPYPLGGNSNSTGTVTTNTDAERTLVTDQAGKSRISKTSALGQLEEVWEVLAASETGSESVAFPGTSIAHGFKTSYSYDTLNNLTTVNQGAQTRTFTYSSLSRLLTATNPESGTISYVYDNSGNLTSKTDARSITTTYAYDALNRVTDREYSDNTPDVEYAYGTTAPKVGLLIKVESSVSATEYTSFDILGRVTGHKQTTDGEVYVTGYKYNLSGALVEQTYPSGRKVKNVIDNNGYLSMVQSAKCLDGTTGTNATCTSQAGLWNYAKNFTYNAAGAMTSMQLGNNRWESTQFNSRLQPTQIGLGVTPGATNLLKLDYSYGDWNGSTLDATKNNGNVAGQNITVTRPGQDALIFDQKYAYDTLNRITSAEEKTDTTVNWNQTYTFDRYGNRNFDESLTTTLIKNCEEFSQPAVCEADRKILNPELDPANNRMAAGQGWTYDTAGNVITDAEGRTFTYDAENKQIEVENAWSQTIGEYFFDGDGKRVKKIVPGTGEVTIFVYDAGAKLIGEYSTIVETQAPKVQYLTNDHLGSPRINTDQNGNVTSRTDYMPYGEEIIGLGNRTANENYVTDDVRQGFTGYENDAETGLDFAQARMYSAHLARFTAPDPLLGSGRINMPQSWNRYVYVLNSPLRFTDPTGLFEWDASLRDNESDSDEEKKRKADIRARILANLELAKQRAKEALDAGRISQKKFDKINNALNAYGTPDDNNGVFVGIKSSSVPTLASRGDTRPFQELSSDDNKLRAVSHVRFEFIGIFENDADVAVVHEGQHIVDNNEFVAFFNSLPSRDIAAIISDPRTPREYGLENNAFHTQSYYFEALGADDKKWGTWNKGWKKKDETEQQKKRQDAINKTIKSGYGLTPDSYSRSIVNYCQGSGCKF
ncbi:MAG TPA: RHS repeat-associated core domain-containing protein [Pyrinomonadaceae bacterium]|nr:RHS repeat-associated core domain-containing protein [Pyrinomonadaceae bacterium]HMP67004.1 RHS repeat-associated core domain-containing protein [Pyrinomonadaceae bacterium]